MANDFWNNLVSLTRRTQARAEAVDSILGAIKSGFDLLPSKARLYEGRVNLCVDSGAANAYVLTPTYAVTLTNGARVQFQVLTTNSGASVANVYGLGNLPVVNYAGAALSGGELVSGAFVDLVYDSVLAKWRIVAPLTAIASVSVTNNVKGDATDALPGTLDDKILVSGSLTKTIADAGGGNRQMTLGFQFDEGQAALYAGVFHL